MPRDKILIYNSTLFSVSQTFIYHQSRFLADNFDVYLIAHNFKNPHGFDISCFNTLKISKSEDFIDNLLGKALEIYFNTSLNIGLKSFKELVKLFKMRNIRAIHVHFGPRSLEILGLAKKFNLPLVVTFHGYDASGYLNNKSYVAKLPDLFDYASAIIIVSKHMIDTLKLERWLNKVHLVPCSVNPIDFSSAKNRTQPDKIKILHSGRMVKKKGVSDLIKVFSELSCEYNHIELHLIGDGEELGKHKNLASELCSEKNVFFYGAVTYDKVIRLLNESDIFVLNSRTDDNGDMEGTPVTILEAMCMGKPVVSTRHAGIPDIIQHGKNGLLAGEYMNEELKSNIEILIKNPELRESLGREAEKTIMELYTTKVIHKKILHVFESI